MKNIVILGGGSAGLRAALDLSKTFKNNNQTNLILIDRHDYHLPWFMLPEVLKNPSIEPNPVAVKKRATLLFEDIFKEKKINFVCGQAKVFNASGRQLTVSGKLVPYDHLIVATGKQPDFSGVLGAESRAMPLQGLADAFRIRYQVEFVAQGLRMNPAQKVFRLVIIGGGWRGAVLADAVKTLAEQVFDRFGLKLSKFEIIVLESKSEAEQDSRWLAALKKSGVTVRYSSRTVRADGNAVVLANGNTQPYDVLLWAGASRSSGLDGLVDAGEIKTDEHFLVKNLHQIYAISGRQQGKYLARALPYLITNKKPAFRYKLDSASEKNSPDKQTSLLRYLWELMGIRGILQYLVRI